VSSPPRLDIGPAIVRSPDAVAAGRVLVLEAFEDDHAERRPIVIDLVGLRLALDQM
jgi:hypothetical protein